MDIFNDQQLPPLAERMRPKSLNDFVGQSHLTGKGKVIDVAIQNDIIPSMIFWGPPGVGKTTLAKIIANETDRPFFILSAINSGVKQVRDVIEKAKRLSKPILFIDEIHRFSKSQQDSLLGAVEDGTITLIGATTENPSFEVISALLSRCQVYTLDSLSKNDLSEMVSQAIQEDSELKKLQIKIIEATALFALSGGDGRKLLNLLELATTQSSSDIVEITDEIITSIAQQKMARYDKNGEQHYDIISAFIKSIRGSDPNAALYYLARMIQGGEDPKFIARRLLILSAEDIGLANPNALVIANSTFDAVSKIGFPESRFILSECVIYLATSPKSNSSYEAINKAIDLVNKTGDLDVPLELRNAPTQLMKELKYGQAYQYAHDFDGNFVDMEFLPSEIKGKKLYEPSKNKREEITRQDLINRWKKYGYQP